MGPFRPTFSLVSPRHRYLAVSEVTKLKTVGRPIMSISAVPAPVIEDLPNAESVTVVYLPKRQAARKNPHLRKIPDAPRREYLTEPEVDALMAAATALQQR